MQNVSVLGTPGIVENYRSQVKLPRNIMSMHLVCIALKSTTAINTAFNSGLYCTEADSKSTGMEPANAVREEK